ncbi:YbhB/YbcL family Raf kinase inhibitor-like protein [Candidatus Pacearchaeota archaeon]|nr:YbhB/YbcL family Raf kinase inhibitor-like protein [Candidatus Pacearchaeota archaeon]
MKITSPAFQQNEKIPSKYTCDGPNFSPPLTISNIPSQAKTIALIVDDPDAPTKTWVHWVVFNIPVPSEAVEISEAGSPGISGGNDFGTTGYGGPCPPSGTHHYFFKAFALDTQLDLQEGATKQQVENAMQSHVLDNSELVGLYSRG